MCSLHAMPLLLINMGGEMVYILQQRLQAQSIPDDKSKKVLNDVVRTMFHETFVTELFKPHELYTNSQTRQIFDRLAHSSIMRLNESSMEKLYDLMTMGFKYQLLNCATPQQLLDVTLNHLSELLNVVDGKQPIALLESAIQSVNHTYGNLRIAEYWDLKQTLCLFFQDRKVKVSLFLQDCIQNMDGSMVMNLDGQCPRGTEVPGTASLFERDGSTKVQYDVGLRVLREFSIKPGPCPPSTLGANLYSKEREEKRGDGTGTGGRGAESKSAEANLSETQRKKRATGELNLLAGLITAPASDGGGDSFKLNLFPDDSFQVFSGESSGAPKAVAMRVDIDGKADRKSMETRMAEMGFDDDAEVGQSKEPDDDDDLLDLMDEAAAKGED